MIHKLIYEIRMYLVTVLAGWMLSVAPKEREGVTVIRHLHSMMAALDRTGGEK